MSILAKIVDVKIREVTEAQLRVPIEDLKTLSLKYKPRGFAYKLKEQDFPSIISEIKRASPSKGPIRPDLDPVETAIEYANNQASCISVLTDKEFFDGNLEFLRKIRAALSDVPLLRKDFIIDPYQIWEAAAHGADAILLIVKALDESQLFSLYNEAKISGLDVLIEVHNSQEAEILCRLIANESKSTKRYPLVGINNRDLATFKTDLQTTEQVIKHIRKVLSSCTSLNIDKDICFVSESGIHEGADLVRLRGFGAKAFLIGESLVASGNPGENLAKLIEEARRP